MACLNHRGMLMLCNYTMGSISDYSIDANVRRMLMCNKQYSYSWYRTGPSSK